MKANGTIYLILCYQIITINVNHYVNKIFIKTKKFSCKTLMKDRVQRTGAGVFTILDKICRSHVKLQ